MITPYDDWIQMPTMDVYNTSMMLAAVQAAKDMYDKSEKRLDNFYEKYGDFISPFSKDMDWYGNKINNINNTLNQMYANGIDPLRSAEGQAMVAQLSRSIDPAEYNRRKTNAKLGFAYLDEVAKARANGEFDEDYENWNLQQPGGPGLFDQFSSEGGRMWNRPSPSKYQDQNTMVSPLFEDMQDEYIDSSRDGQYDYSGVSRDRRALILQANLGSILKTPNGRYHYELAKQEYARRFGETPTEAEALSFYQDQLLDASDRFEHRTRTENKDWARRRESQLRMAEDDHRTANDIRAYERKAETDYDWETRALMDTNRDKKISEEERTEYTGVGGSKKGKDNENVFTRTDANKGSNTIYDTRKSVEEKITPYDGRISFNKGVEKDDADSYEIPNDLISSVLFEYDSADNKMRPLDVSETKGTENKYFGLVEAVEDTDSSTFIATGQMFYVKDKNGNKQYYIHGYVSGGNDYKKDCVMRVSRRR